jgi:hypothetical protein
VTPEKVNLIVRDPLDFLSMDTDGSDYPIWKALKAKPTVVCIEYCAEFGAPLHLMKILGESKGYEFVGVSASGVNAFFVHKRAMTSG